MAIEVVIVKKVKSGHGGHHGGAWKVAYADFVTAMMASLLCYGWSGKTNRQKRRWAIFPQPRCLHHNRWEHSV